MTLGMLFAAWSGLALAETTAGDPAAQRINDAVRSHIAKTARVEEADVEIRWLGLSAVIDCPCVPEVLVDTPPGEDFRGRTDLRVTLIADNVECGRFRLPARVAIWTDTPVARADVGSGERVRFGVGRVSTDMVRGTPVLPAEGPWIAIRHLRAGDPVTERDVRRAPEVYAGDEIKLLSGIPGLRVTADARMLNDANIGDEVRVSNLATDTVVRGILVDHETVRIGGRR